MTNHAKERANHFSCFSPGDLYEDVFYHPCLAMGVGEDELWGISLIDGSYPRCCCLAHSAIRKISRDEACELKQWHIRNNGADGWWMDPIRD